MAQLAEDTGVAICESYGADAVYLWSPHWNAVLDVTVEPVLDDAEARAVIRDAFGD